VVLSLIHADNFHDYPSETCMICSTYPLAVVVRDLSTVCTHKHRHPPAPCEQGFSPENVACLSVLGQKKTEKGVAVFMRAYGIILPTVSFSAGNHRVCE
jgi:hypothetical protein